MKHLKEGSILAGSVRIDAARHDREGMVRELEAAAHMASTVRKQRLMDAGALSLLSPFYSVQDPSLWNGTPTISLSPI